MVYWFFGFPGIGKDYCAKKFSELTGSSYVSADSFLTAQEKEKLMNGTFTKIDRLIKLERICAALMHMGANIAIADSLPDAASRDYVHTYFNNNVRFLLVTASPEIHRQRIARRTDHFFTADILDRWIAQHWNGNITIPYTVIKNSSQDIEEQLRRIMS